MTTPTPPSFIDHIQSELKNIETAGLYKKERIITSPQSNWITLSDGRKVLNMCSNNYLGFANHPKLVEAAQHALKTHGFGMASVRFICGTQDLHRELESTIARFFGTEDAILYSSCFDANGGLFEALLNPEDAIISDALNHASIIDGIRLCKATRYRYSNCNLIELEEQLQAAQSSRFKMIATDGVFSMDGCVADLKSICSLAKKYNAITMMDDSHAAGFFGKPGRGASEHCDVLGKIDIITGTLGKALGGASGGYTTGKKAIIDLLRQRSRPYLFSNTLTPCITAAALAAFKLLEESNELPQKLAHNTTFFRKGLESIGLQIKPGSHPIIPIMIGDAVLSQKVAARMLELGVYVVGFFYPVVPQGTARIRTQISALHTEDDLSLALEKFAQVKKEFKL